MADKLSGSIYLQDASCEELMLGEQEHGRLTVNISQQVEQINWELPLADMKHYRFDHNII